MMTTTNNHLVADEAGVEIIPDTTVTATEESNVIVDAAAAPPKPKWTTKGVSIAGIGALCVIAVGYSTKYTGSPTSSSQQQQMQQTAIEATLFEQLGGVDVECQDSQSNYYPFIGYGGVSSAEECGVMCSMCPGNNQDGLVLRGFNYLGQSNNCVCLVDFGNSFDETLCEGAIFAYDAFLGSGEIVNTVPSYPGIECWKVSSPSSSKARKSSKAPKSSKRPVRKLGQKNDSLLSNVERKTDSQTII